MKRYVLIGMIGLVGGNLLAGDPKRGAPDKTLAPGAYTATVKAFVCGGCAEWIQSKLSADKRLVSVVADQETRVLTFKVKKGAAIKASDVQKILNQAAKDMGMGADYTLDALKKA